MSKYIYCLLLFFSHDVALCAQVISGTVLSVDNNETLPYVNIGIRNKNIGTISSIDGKFSIAIPEQNKEDTLVFSMVGFEDLRIPVCAAAKCDSRFMLQPRASKMSEVRISSQKLVEKKYGMVKYKPLLHFLDASINQEDIFEIAQVVKLNMTSSKITSVNLHINDDRRDSGIFRINFYSFDGNRPGNRIVEKSIIQKKAIRDGWMRFDIAQYGVYLKGEVVVALEFIPTKGVKEPIKYEIKIGGRSKSFVRTSSVGEWSVPPAQYRMYVTALCEDGNNKNEEDEEKESKPAFGIYSENVKDSFSIFVHLPADYDKHKKEQYNVVYLLDANVYFDNVAAYLEKQGKHSEYKEPILVGIGYRDFAAMDSLRDRDYTYPITKSRPGFTINGGGAKFYDFIEKELCPYMGKHYRIESNNNALMGHSLGGYFVLYAMEREMETGDSLFKYYISASPALDYDEEFITERLRNGGSAITRMLYLSKGGMEDKEEGENNTKERDEFDRFTKSLTGAKLKNIVVSKEIYPSAGHMATAIQSFEKGLDLVMTAGK